MRIISVWELMVRKRINWRLYCNLFNEKTHIQCILTHTHSHEHIHMHAHTRAHTHTHTHTHIT